MKKRMALLLLGCLFAFADSTPVALVPLPAFEGDRERNQAWEAAQQDPVPTSGTKMVCNVLVLVRFAGEEDFTQDDLDRILGVYTTVGAYYREVSCGQAEVKTTALYDRVGSAYSYQDARPRNYYLARSDANPQGYRAESEARRRESELLVAATDWAAAFLESDTNFDQDGDGNVDNITFVIKGQSVVGSSILWPHQFSLDNLGTAWDGKRPDNYNLIGETLLDPGVVIHEMYHTFGAPDYDSKHKGYYAVGAWDIANEATRPPQHMTAYSKARYGMWMEPAQTITRSGTYTLRPLGTHPEAYQIEVPGFPGQSFYLEYRDATSARGPHWFDSSIPDSGLLIVRGVTTLLGNKLYPLDELYVLREGNAPDLYSVNNRAARKPGQTAGRGEDLHTGFPLLYYAREPANVSSVDGTLATLNDVLIEVVDMVQAGQGRGESLITFQVTFAHPLAVYVENDTYGKVEVETGDPQFGSDGKVLCGQNVTLAATAREGYRFSHWEAEGYRLTEAQATDAGLELQMPDNAIAFTAVFVPAYKGNSQ